MAESPVFNSHSQHQVHSGLMEQPAVTSSGFYPPPSPVMNHMGPLSPSYGHALSHMATNLASNLSNVNPMYDNATYMIDNQRSNHSANINTSSQSDLMNILYPGSSLGNDGGFNSVITKVPGNVSGTPAITTSTLTSVLTTAFNTSPRTTSVVHDSMYRLSHITTPNTQHRGDADWGYSANITSSNINPSVEVNKHLQTHTNPIINSVVNDNSRNDNTRLNNTYDVFSMDMNEVSLEATIDTQNVSHVQKLNSVGDIKRYKDQTATNLNSASLKNEFRNTHTDRTLVDKPSNQWNVDSAFGHESQASDKNLVIQSGSSGLSNSQDKSSSKDKLDNICGEQNSDFMVLPVDDGCNFNLDSGTVTQETESEKSVTQPSSIVDSSSISNKTVAAEDDDNKQKDDISSERVDIRSNTTGHVLLDPTNVSNITDSQTAATNIVPMVNSAIENVDNVSKQHNVANQLVDTRQQDTVAKELPAVAACVAKETGSEVDKLEEALLTVSVLEISQLSDEHLFLYG